MAGPPAWSPADANVTGGGPQSVASSVSSVVLFASNGDAKERVVFNASTSVLYIAYAATASAAAYSFLVPANTLWEAPTGAGGGIYTGIVSGIWVAANGSAECTEVS